MKTAIQTLKEEMDRIHQAMDECIDDSGCIKNSEKYKYQTLARTYHSFKETLTWLEDREKSTHSNMKPIFKSILNRHLGV